MKRTEDLEREIVRLKTQLQERRRYGFLGNTTKICGDLIRAGRIVAPWVFAWLIVRELAGKTTVTVANASLSLGGESFSETLRTLARQYLGITSLYVLLGMLAIGGLVYGNRQARLRRDDSELLGWFKSNYEKLIDPNRSSSNITSRGETRPEDE